MAKDTAVTSGFTAFDKTLKKIGGKESKKIVRSATRKGLKPVQQEIKQTIPEETGASKRSVKVRSIKRSRQMIGSKVTSNEFPSFVELGTKHIDARNTFKDSAEKKKKQAQRIMGEEIGRGIEGLAKRG